MIAKYVVLLVGETEVPVLVAKNAGVMHKELVPAGGKAIAAGFCVRLEVGCWRAYGESLSLGLKSREHIDSELLTRSYEL